MATTDPFYEVAHFQHADSRQNAMDGDAAFHDDFVDVCRLDSDCVQHLTLLLRQLQFGGTTDRVAILIRRRFNERTERFK